MITDSKFEPKVNPFLSGPSPEKLLSLNFAYAQSRLLNSAIELGIFDYIEQGMTHCETLAIAMECSTKGVHRLLNALCGVNLLKQDNNYYELSDLSRKFLIRSSPCYLGNHLISVMNQWDRWSNLTEIIRSGEPLETDSPEFHNISLHTFPIAFPVAWEHSAKIQTSENCKILHVRPGSGEWSISMAARHSSSMITVIDTPNRLLSVKNYVDPFELSSQFTYIPEDFSHWEPLEQAFDLILFTHAFRFIGPDLSKQWIEKAHKVLKKDGQLILVDIMFSDKEETLSVPFMIGLSLLIQTQEGNVESIDNYCSWIKDAGFESIEMIETLTYPIIVARR